MSENEKEGFLDKKPVKFGITIVLIAGLIGVSYDLFLSPEPPTASETGEQMAKNLLPVIVEETSKDSPDISYEKNPEVSPDLIVSIPMTVGDMVNFLLENPEIPDDDADVLLSYAVGKEHGMLDPEVDAQARKIMVEYLEGNQ